MHEFAYPRDKPDAPSCDYPLLFLTARELRDLEADR